MHTSTYDIRIRMIYIFTFTHPSLLLSRSVLLTQTASLQAVTFFRSLVDEIGIMVIKFLVRRKALGTPGSLRGSPGRPRGHPEGPGHPEGHQEDRRDHRSTVNGRW